MCPITKELDPLIEIIESINRLNLNNASVKFKRFIHLMQKWGDIDINPNPEWFNKF
jgi:hypothetical protein